MRLHRPFTLCLLLLVFCLALSFSAMAQTCFTSDDMDTSIKAALQNTAMRYFDMVSKGDTASLRQNSIPAVANSFEGIANTIKANQTALTGSHAAAQPPFELQAQGTAALTNAEFLCGVFNSALANKAVQFVIPSLPPGTYGIVLQDVTTQTVPYTLSLILQQEGTDWKLAGFYLRSSQIAGHDSAWYLTQARAYKSKGQTHNAWLYFWQGRDLAMPLPFMYTKATGQLYDEEQSVRPSDFPIDGSSTTLVGQNGKTYTLTAVFPLAVDEKLDLVVKYLSPDVSNTGQTFQENMELMRDVLAKFPELRDAFAGIVVRAVEPSGRDYGSMMPMADIK